MPFVIKYVRYTGVRNAYYTLFKSTRIVIIRLFCLKCVQSMLFDCSHNLMNYYELRYKCANNCDMMHCTKRTTVGINTFFPSIRSVFWFSCLLLMPYCCRNRCQRLMNASFEIAVRHVDYETHPMSVHQTLIIISNLIFRCIFKKKCLWNSI